MSLPDTQNPWVLRLGVVLHAVVLFAFWITLSGKVRWEYDAFYLVVGFLSAVGVAIWTRPLMMMDTSQGPRHAMTLPWWRFIGYLPWLLLQIWNSSVQVAVQVLKPSMPISPEMVRIKVDLPGEVAYLTLANSITLTPGTVTVDRDGDELLIHALSKPAAEGLLEGDMQERVARVFRSPVSRGDRLKGEDADA